MTELTVLYVALLGGAFTGCASYVRALLLRHREDG